MYRSTLWCGVCGDHTLHTVEEPRQCLKCKEQDRRDMQDAVARELKRIREAEGSTDLFNEEDGA